MYCELATICRRTRHLMEFPENDAMLESFYTAIGLDGVMVHGGAASGASGDGWYFLLLGISSAGVS
jgi:hypothetical protein